MEQQDQVQSVAESSKDSKSLEGEWAQETTELSLNDVSAPYEFRDGLYYCEGLEGAYTSLPLLRRAWATKLKAEKIEAARKTARASRASEQDKKKAIKEYQKWHQTEVK